MSAPPGVAPALATAAAPRPSNLRPLTAGLPSSGAFAEISLGPTRAPRAPPPSLRRHAWGGQTLGCSRGKVVGTPTAAAALLSLQAPGPRREQQPPLKRARSGSSGTQVTPLVVPTTRGMMAVAKM